MGGLSPLAQRFSEIHPDRAPVAIHNTSSGQIGMAENAQRQYDEKRASRLREVPQPPKVQRGNKVLCSGSRDSILRDPFHRGNPEATYSLSYSRSYEQGALKGTPSERPPSMPLGAIKESGPRCHNERKCDMHAKGYTAEQTLILAREDLLEEKPGLVLGIGGLKAQDHDDDAEWEDMEDGSTVIRRR
ncbi:hypothetical protein CB0940_08772 [Cercospora beticola]|uniref:Uncharacterized protein n=1 Tax=Cercospora beticola TaxID=122368 RepID=A0A2G5HP13_CERBT|nr:hypothetical protein CB0940_08772 [Cercospora beticola]PIA94280.1 hypothetical protein CB0940_08772 [Cercospora beticola]WPB05355.1 hypothetical protein RHO25_010007 [Cercospora beticola]CAK1365158.1 unnamed protein product [Cercospora beticola]